MLLLPEATVAACRLPSAPHQETPHHSLRRKNGQYKPHCPRFVAYVEGFGSTSQRELPTAAPLRPALRRVLQLSHSAQAPERSTSPLHSLHHLYVTCIAFMLPRPSSLTMSLPSLLLVRKKGQILQFFTPSSSCSSNGTQHPALPRCLDQGHFPVGSTTQTGRSCWTGCLRNCPCVEPGHPDMLGRAPGPRASSGAGQQMVGSAKGNLLVVIREDVSLSPKTFCAVAEHHMGQQGLTQ